MSTLVVRPVTGFEITQLWGQISGAAWGVRNPNGAGGHPGVDYGCPNGTPVRSVADGVVIYAGPAQGFGDHLVSIWHPQFGVTSRYGHMQANLVNTGDAVYAGQQIGISNNEGESTGAHLHLEVGVGQLIDAGNPPNIDPELWMLQHFNSVPIPPQLTQVDRNKIANFQRIIKVNPDGHWGPATDHAAELVAWIAATHPTTSYPIVKQLQALWGLVQDGLWGPKTTYCYNLWRYCYLGK